MAYDDGLFLSNGRTFHFAATPPANLLSAQYLGSGEPRDVVRSVLAHAQVGRFRHDHFRLLIELMKRHDEVSLWIYCARLLSYAAPASVLRDLPGEFEAMIFQDGDAAAGQWISEILCESGALWGVPDVLRILRANNDRRTYSETPLRLSLLLEAERGDIAAGPKEIPEPGVWPEWYEPDITFNDDGYDRLVLQRRDEVAAAVADPERACIFEGKLVSLPSLAQKTLDRVVRGGGAEEILAARTILEAQTGRDLSGFYSGGQLAKLDAAALLEEMLEDDKLLDYRPGTRYFFGHPVPD